MSALTHRLATGKSRFLLIEISAELYAQLRDAAWNSEWSPEEEASMRLGLALDPVTEAAWTLFV